MLMRVAFPEALITIPRPSTGHLKAWAVGQLLTATVIGRDTENSIRLRIDGETLRASTDLPLRTGARIALQVVSTGSVPTLRTLPVSDDRGLTVIRDALKLALPRQQPLGATFEHLAREVAAAPTLKSPPLPPPLQRLVNDTLLKLATSDEVTNPARLAAKLRESGTGLEAELQRRLLAGSSEPPRDDLKWQLLRIRRAIDKVFELAVPVKAANAAPKPVRAEPPAGAAPAPVSEGRELPKTLPPVAEPVRRELPAMSPPRGVIDIKPASPLTTPSPNKAVAEEPPPPVQPDRREVLGELRRQLDGAIARIQTNQLQSLGPNPDHASHLIFELPIRTPEAFDLLRLEVDRDHTADTDESGSPITVTLEFSTKHSAPLTAKLSIRDARLSVSLWSEDAVLRDRIASNKDWLVTRLETAGLEPTSVVVAPVRARGQPQSGETGFIDTAI